MANLDLKYKIKVPFADKGNRDNIPDTSPDGLANNTDGLGVKYELEIPEGGEYFSREVFNGVLYKVYAAVKELQDLAVAAGFPIDMEKALNVLGIPNGGTDAKNINDARKNLQTFAQANLPAGSNLNDLSQYIMDRMCIQKTGFNHTNAAPGATTGFFTTYIDTNFNRGWQKFNPPGVGNTGDFRCYGRIYNNGVWENWTLLRNPNGSVPLPIGFIYLQFRGQLTPDEIFGSGGQWQDISSTYAGEFFRAAGGNAASFGSKQNEGLPNITGTFSMKGAENYNVTGAFRVDRRIGIGSSGTGEGTQYSFQASRSNSIYGASSHVTPYNSAVRVWKKIS